MSEPVENRRNVKIQGIQGNLRKILKNERAYLFFLVLGAFIIARP